MKILVVGSGGREHAIVHAIAGSSEAHEVLVAPGNAGTAEMARNISVAADDVSGLSNLAVSEGCDLVVVGPEVPLVLGLADELRALGIPVVGPSALASRLEGSKSFSKLFMEKYEIPTAAYQVFLSSQVDEALSYVQEKGAPIVVKASGLAAGKGAIVCATVEDALEAVSSLLHDRVLGQAADEIVIESFMVGEEASIFVLTDGTDYVLLPPAQDHKQIGEGDTGVNTGGMGAYAPAPLIDETLLADICRLVVEPTLRGMRDEGCPYSGILYCGLMITENGPMVVEYNCRLGDPEAQVVLPLIESDVSHLFYAMATEAISEYDLVLSPRSAACVVMASGGYPGPYEKGKELVGLDQAKELDDVTVYMAGVALDSEARAVTSGGRVLACTGLGADLGDAIKAAYAGVERISFDDQYFRRDIGVKGLRRSALT